MARDFVKITWSFIKIRMIEKSRTANIIREIQDMMEQSKEMDRQPLHVVETIEITLVCADLHVYLLFYRFI